MGRIVHRAAQFCYRAGSALGILLIALMVATLSAGVVSRYVFNRPIFWTDELSRIILNWTIFIGASLAFRKGAVIEHIGMDFLALKFPSPWRVRTRRIVRGILILFWLGLLLISLVFVVQTASIPTAALGISRGFIYVALTVSAAMSLVFLLDRGQNK